MDRLRFISLASGSSGNCYFIGTAFGGILIDAGIGARTIKKRLKEKGIPFEHIHAVFVTHDHIDHIKAVGALGEKHHIPIYATELVHQGIDRSYGVTEKLIGCKHILEKKVPVEILEFKVEAFAVSHDATDNVGYTIYYKNKRFTVATDLGYICIDAAEHIRKANYLVVEANYDEDMLVNGHYPAHLKKRVASLHGHMNNADTADFLAHNYHEGLDHIYLCHLSKDNNTPEKAIETVSSQLARMGIIVGQHVTLLALSRNTPTELFIYE